MGAFFFNFGIVLLSYDAVIITYDGDYFNIGNFVVGL